MRLFRFDSNTGPPDIGSVKNNFLQWHFPDESSILFL